MLEKIILGNFKGFKDIHEINLAPINFIFGQNSSGKTALIQSLSLFNQSQQNSMYSTEPLNFLGPEVDLGGFKNVIFNHDMNRELIFGFQVKNSSTNVYRHHTLLDSIFSSTKIEFFFKWNESQKSCYIDSLKLTFLGNENLEIELNRMKDPKFLTLKTFDKNSFEFAAKIKNLFHQICEMSEVENLQEFGHGVSINKIKSYFNKKSESMVALDIEKDVVSGVLSFDENLFNLNSAFFYSKNLEIRNDKRINANFISVVVIQMLDYGYHKLGFCLDLFKHIGPIRPDPERIYFNNSPGNEMIKVLLKNQEIKSAINATLFNMSIPYEVKVDKIISDYYSAGEYNSLSFIDTRTGTEVSGKDIGYGISQILPIIYECIHLLIKNSFLSIEQPELHLHPRVQLELANFFVDILKTSESDVKSSQLMIETHSENLILRIQNLVKKGKLSSDEVQIIYVGSSRDIGSWHKEIKLLPNGELADEWPGGFFTERLEEWGM